MRHRAFLRVDQQHDTVHHAQHAFHFTTEVGVSRGVDDIDMGAVVINGGVLGQNGNAAFTLEIVRVHDALGDVLVVAEGACLMQQLVDQRGFAVVDVSNDGDVAEIAGHGF